MSKVYGNFIGGEWVACQSKKTFADYNPAHTKEIVAEFQDSGAPEVKSAIDAASGALDAWGRMQAPKRADFFRKAAEILRRRRDEAADALTREEGKNIGEARGEIDRGIALMSFYAGQWPALGGEMVPSFNEGRMLYTLRVPVGVVALITPWNFPAAIPMWKTLPALLCGNTVVLKPSSLAPHSSALFAEVLAEAGLPAGVFNMVTGGGREVGDVLVSDPRIRAISFTGSREVGKAIMRKVADRLIRVGLEMGGKNPMIVMDDANLDRAVEDTVVGAFWAAGHKCTATSRAIVTEKIHDQFVEKLVTRTKALRIGDGMDPKTEVCPVIDENQTKKILEYIEIGKKEGAKLLCGGERLKGGIYDEGCYVAPAVFAGLSPNMRTAQEEIFGPVVGVIKVKDFDEAMRVANNIEFGLSASISTRDLKTALEFARRSEAGIVHVNSPTAGLELQAPFGGCKESTSGYREMGKVALDFYSQIKTVYVDA